ncbi:MAG: hypothetical protein ACRDHF_06775 [Tepidiformaceae bacterium]
MAAPNDPENEDAKRPRERRRGDAGEPVRTTQPAAYHVEPGGPGASILWWALAGLGMLVIAGLVGLGIWAANEDDENRSDVAGAQSQAVTIDDQGFTAQQAEIDLGDSVDLANVGDEECALAANGEPVTVIRAGESYAWPAPEAGRFTLTCDGRSAGELEVTVGR